MALNADQRTAYERDGVVFPVDVMSGEEALALRREIEVIETAHGGRLAVADYLRGFASVVVPAVHDAIRNPAILDAVEPIIGPDLLVWGCQFFNKDARTDDYVGWHQDLTYWGLDQLDEVTAWIALSPSTIESGCMRMIPGSHKQDIVAHTDTHADANILSRGQELTVQPDESQAVDLVLAPGQMSLHHGHTFHSSQPNRSNDRRIGLVIRYIAPHMKQIGASRDYATLVRGEDRYGHFTTPPRPTADFAPEAVAFHDKMIADQSEYLYREVETG
ncbi:MAG: phytanoyl-CoA dioxygenase family protein [Alphaproteobacteria bacterium]